MLALHIFDFIKFCFIYEQIFEEEVLKTVFSVLIAENINKCMIIRGIKVHIVRMFYRQLLQHEEEAASKPRLCLSPCICDNHQAEILEVIPTQSTVFEVANMFFFPPM